jgi:hypothetical protein
MYIHLKAGACYMITYNVDTCDGLTNSDSGTLMRTDVGIHKDISNKIRLLKVWIRFEDDHVGERLRQKQWVPR